MAIEIIKVPDLGGAQTVDVIEILVTPGDTIEKEDSLVTLEGDKASMEIPAPLSGTVKEIQIKLGDKVSEGSAILTLETAASEISKETAESNTETPAEEPPKPVAATPQAVSEQAKPPETAVTSETSVAAPSSSGEAVHAGPAVRRLAREFGVDLNRVTGSGEKQRILKEDVQKFVKSALAGGGASSGNGLAVAPAPVIDFSQFGETELKPLSKIKRLTGVNTHRSWVTVPHVTQFDEADITELEAFRKHKKAEAEKQGYKLTPLVFIMKALVKALQHFPSFNASLDPTGEQLILKKYYNIGVAVDTPNGLVVPVIRDVDQKGLFELSKELRDISTKAREKGLMPNEMSGGCMTISSLGGISGTAFTPIVNTPEVAILGVSKSQMKPVYQNGEFVPRLILPLSLSYDHRVIDGAEAARFSGYLSQLLSDIREVLL